MSTGVRVVESYPPGPGRFGRALSGVAGVALLIAAVFVALLPMISGTLIVVDESDVVDPARLLDIRVAGLVLLDLALAVLLVWAGLRLRRGPRRLSLLVRRSGYDPATATISEIVAATTNRSWRALMLDDSSLAPAEAVRRVWWLPLRTAPVVAALGVAGVWWVVGGRALATVASTGFVVAMIGLAVAAVVVGAVCVDALVLDPVRLVRRPDLVVIDEARPERLARRSRRALGPRVSVGTVGPARWDTALAALAGVSSAVIADLSHVDEQLVADVAQLLAAGQDVVLVCHQDRLAHMDRTRLNDPGPGADDEPAHADTPYRRMALLIDGRDVLVYGGQDSARQMARSLQRRLDAVPREVVRQPAAEIVV